MLNPNISYNLGAGVRSLANKGNNVNELGGVKEVKSGDSPEIKTSAVWRGTVDSKGNAKGPDPDKVLPGDVLIDGDGNVYEYKKEGRKGKWEKVATKVAYYYIMDALEPTRGKIRG